MYSSTRCFIGTSRNAVETQIWTALSTMLLLCWLKHIAKYKWGLANLVVSLRLNTFTKIELEKWLNEPFTPPPEPDGVIEMGPKKALKGLLSTTTSYLSYL